ncbi:10 kDa chaperonin [Neorickettsia helminthoeca str. Oregon]|uniref:Co-chaperonin GroES n=2 Tax=Neorickettsia helminthoeca TaxID=33994 RepID=X5HM82_9RICK|nr:heat shock protein GroES [Neorickettsia helminthoeca]AHX11550.1 10 kDa chaperonin [Neorickettsia helminthoeca str. Oregon]
MNIGLKMLHDQVLIKPQEEQDGASGIYIPDSAKKKPTIGVVVAVGQGAKNSNGTFDPVCVKEGDVVLYRKWAGSEVEHDGVEYVVMKESDIIAVKEGK